MNNDQVTTLHNAINAFRSSGYQIYIDIHDIGLLPFSIKVEDDRILIEHDGQVIMTITAKQDVNSPGTITFSHREQATKEIDLLDPDMKKARQIMLDERL